MARGLPSGLMRPKVCSKEPFSQCTECQDRAIAEEVPDHMQAVFNHTAEETRLVDFIVQSQGDEQHLVVLSECSHFLITD